MVPLACAQNAQVHGVLRSFWLVADGCEVGPTCALGVVDVPIAGPLTDQERRSPTVVVFAGVVADGGFGVTVVTNGFENRSALLHLRRFGENRNGTTYRWNRQSRSTQAALDLDAGSYVRQTLPVRPVHPSILHVIDRLAVDEE